MADEDAKGGKQSNYQGVMYEQNRIIDIDYPRDCPSMDGLSFMAWDMRGSPGNLFNTGRRRERWTQKPTSKKK